MLLTALEFCMRGVDSSVDNINTSTSTGSAIVGVRGDSLSDVGNAAKTPGGGALGDIGALLHISKVGLHDGILLNVFDLVGVSMYFHSSRM
jgi:hypothetical protein